MNDNRDQKLDNLLRSRRVEPASAGLAQRIILKARSLPQSPNISLWESMRQLFAEFHLPKPGYVLASALVLGMVIGFSAPQDRSPFAEESSASVQSFLAGDETLL
ncbi:MAG: hypothetical protein ACREQ2_24930 [Candidatus Binatia bacterium]